MNYLTTKCLGNQLFSVQMKIMLSFLDHTGCVICSVSNVHNNIVMVLNVLFTYFILIPLFLLTLYVLSILSSTHSLVLLLRKKWSIFSGDAIDTFVFSQFPDF